MPRFHISYYVIDGFMMYRMVVPLAYGIDSWPFLGSEECDDWGKIAYWHRLGHHFTLVVITKRAALTQRRINWLVEEST